MENYSTNCNGFKFTCLKDITKGEYVNLCLKLSDKLNQHFNLTENKIFIYPEGISEGGFHFTNNNCGDYNGYYKTMRHRVMTHEFNNIEWPWITNTTLKEWENSGQILFPKKSHSYTSLYSVSNTLNNAPVWTLEELLIFKETLEEFGFKVVKMPKKKDLIY